MDKIALRPLAKVNFGLDVVGKREDGYHEVRMVMQTLSLHDHMVMEKQDNGKVSLKTNLRYLPTDKNNLVIQAIELLREEFHISQGVRVNLKKVIPVAGGMAGGSSDAAAAIFGMNKLFDLHLSRKDMMERGLTLGADVPYCIMRGTALAEGIGEVLTPLPGIPKCGVLIVKPAFSVSTKKVYEAFDKQSAINHPNMDKLLEAVSNQDMDGILMHMGNNLEDVTKRMHPIIGRIEEQMEQAGARRAMMSGSGPTVFGIFDTIEEAQRASRVFQSRKDIGQVHVTTIYNVKGR
ncbi:4-diphosphocytidyl-2-C-methyl-D-erythritol kinase [Lachnospiraceae bacterium XBB1006]|nr:4-diphosphocytidyl-2-C-methyl-D-erythritol kinase [Lachnospiraceae bacterium XBB1006]